MSSFCLKGFNYARCSVYSSLCTGASLYAPYNFLGSKWHSPIGLMPFHKAQKTLEFPDLKFRTQICHPGWVALSVAVLFCVFPCSFQLAGQHPGSWHYHGVLALHGVQSSLAAGESGPAVVIFILRTVLIPPALLGPVPSAQAVAAQLQADGISSCFYVVNIQNQLS